MIVMLTSMASSLFKTVDNINGSLGLRPRLYAYACIRRLRDFLCKAHSDWEKNEMRLQLREAY